MSISSLGRSRQTVECHMRSVLSCGLVLAPIACGTMVASGAAAGDECIYQSDFGQDMSGFRVVYRYYGQFGLAPDASKPGPAGAASKCTGSTRGAGGSTAERRCRGELCTGSQAGGSRSPTPRITRSCWTDSTRSPSRRSRPRLCASRSNSELNTEAAFSNGE